MHHDNSPADTEMSRLEKKIYVIADEVLDILKQLSRENKRQLNARLIAEKMFTKDTVKQMLTHPAREKCRDGKDFSPLRTIADGVLDKLSELLPSFMNEKFRDLKDRFDDDSILEDSTVWLNASIRIVRKYIDSISNKNKELELFIQQTIEYLSETEQRLMGELSARHEKFNEDRAFEKDISEHMSMIEQDFSSGADISDIRKAVLDKIENINRSIEKKREQDMLRLRETERTLQEMGRRISDIKKEADELKKRAEEIENESFHDKLTGLKNRKAYDEEIVKALAGMQRYNVPYSLMICDIDHFKKINDTYGHKVGDLTLRKLAALLKERLRTNDFIARYGGEEFAVILSHTTLKDAVKVAENVRSFINDSLFSYKNRKIPVTVSIGISSFRRDDDGTTIFERADEALYLAKESGRNTVKTEEDVISRQSILN